MTEEDEKGWRHYETCAEFSKTFAHPVRLAIVENFRDGEKTVSQLGDALKVRQPTISQHLSMLRRLGIAQTRREGHSIYYRLTDQGVLAVYDSVNRVIRDSVLRRAEAVA